MNSRFKGFAKGRKPGPRTMNRTEAAYMAILEADKVLGKILWYRYEPVRLVLASGQKLQYTPDFMVMTEALDLEFHEVKGSFIHNPTSIVKLKMAADLFPFVFRLAMKGKKGVWTITRIGEKDGRDEEDENTSRN